MVFSLDAMQHEVMSERENPSISSEPTFDENISYKKQPNEELFVESISAS